MATIVKIENIKIGKYLTVAAAAEMTGIKEQGIRQKLYEGTWVTYKFGHMTLIATAQIEAYLKNRDKAAKG